MTEELLEILTKLWDQFLELLPQLIISLVVLGIGYLVARLVKYLAIRFVKYLSKKISIRFENLSLDNSAPFIGIAFFWLVIVATLLLISNILKLTFITNGLELILLYSPNIFAAILIIFAALVLGKFISKSISTLGVRLGLSYSNTLGKIAQYLILLSAIIISIDQIGVEVTFIINLMNITLASLFFGAAFAFGIGAKTSVSNILATFYVRKMYKVGDSIKINDIEGRIIRIEATMVVLETNSGQYMIPSKEFSETKSFLIKST